MAKLDWMEKLRRFVNKNNMLYKILISYILIVVLGFTVFAVIMTNVFMRNAKNVIQNTTNTMLKQSYNTADILLKHNFTYYYDLFYEDSTMIQSLYADEMSDKEAVDTYKYLQNVANNDIITDSIYIYNGTMNKIFSSIPGEYSPDSFYDQEIVDVLKNQSGFNKDVYEPRSISVDIAGKKKETSVITYILSMDLDKNANSHALIVNIDQSTLQKMITGPLKDISVSTTIINKQAMVMSASDSSLLYGTMEDDYIKKILDSGKDNGEIEISTNKEDFYIAYQKSDMLNWYFIGMADYDDILIGFRNVYKIICIVALLFVLLGLLVASVSTKNIYMPIYMLLKDMRDKVDIEKQAKNKKDLNEYEYLSNTFDNLMENVEALKEQVQTNNRIRRDELLLQILNGEYSLQNFNEVWDEYGIHISSPFFQVLSFQMDDFYKLCAAYSKEDMNLFKFVISNVADETLGAYYHVDSVADGAEHVAMIVQRDTNSIISDNEFKEHLKELRENFNKFIPWFSISISVGQCVNGYMNIPVSYSKAQSIMSYRIFYGKRADILFDEIPEKISRNTPYPVEEEKKLLSAIRQRNESQTDIALEGLFQSFQNYMPDEIPLIINQVVLNAVREVFRANSSGEQGDVIDWQAFIGSLNYLDTLEEMKAETANFFHSLEQFQNTANSVDRKNEIVDTLKRYVTEHYGDSELCVESLAEDVGLSANYVRQIFKGIAGQSLSEFILNTRIEKAQQLLLTTDFTAKAIASMVGYADNRYFYVVFKRCTGITTEEFRKQNSK